MNIPFLDALLPPAPSRTAPNSADPAIAGMFEALLAGLEPEKTASLAVQPTLASEEIVPSIVQSFFVAPAIPALPGTPLPPTGKSLPHLESPLAEDNFVDVATGLVRLQTDDVTNRPTEESEAPPIQAQGPDVVAQYPSVTAIPAYAALPVTAPAAPSTSTAASLPAPRELPAGATALTPQTAPALAPDVIEREQLVPQISPAASATPASLVSQPTGAVSVAGSTDIPKPVPPQTSTLALPPNVAPVAIGIAPTPLKRAQESKPGLVAFPVTFEMPSAIAAAPLSIQPPVALGEGAPAASQAPAQAIALPDHRALVEALVRARTERDPGVSVALETREFGAVALRFETLQSITGERGLQVGLSSSDPGFERAVASAAAAQAALADQSGRNPTSRGDAVPTRSADPAANPFGNAPGGRSTSSDPQSQHRSGQTETLRDPHNPRSPEPSLQGDDRPSSLRLDRRLGAIFA